jgi:hypothetical protein
MQPPGGMNDRVRKARAHVKANAIAYLALFVALGGTTYAAARIGSDDIERNAVKSRHIGRDQVRSADATRLRGVDILNDSLTGYDINEATIGAVPGARNADRLDNLDSGDFVTASRMRIAGPLRLDDVDTSDGAFSETSLIKVGHVTLLADCNNLATGPSMGTQARIDSLSDPGVVGTRLSFIRQNQAGIGTDVAQSGVIPSPGVVMSTSNTPVTDARLRIATIAIVESDGTAYHGNIYAGAGLGPSHCIFGASLVGG